MVLAQSNLSTPYANRSSAQSQTGTSDAIKPSKKTTISPQAVESRSRTIKTINTAFVASHSKGTSGRDPYESSSLSELIGSEAFDQIVSAVQCLANARGISELHATLELLSVFRRLDTFWTEALLQEGFEKLQSSR